MLLEISHHTLYRYSQPVSFSPHRLMVRPMEGHDVQIRSSILRLQPAHRLRWLHDVFDNSIAIADFTEPAAELRVESLVTVEQYNTNPFDFVLDPEATRLPFLYRPEELPDLLPYLQRDHPADEEALRHWLRPFLKPGGGTATLDFLTALNQSIPLAFTYTRREEPGVQSPGETLRRRAGSCRDFALLFMEAARHLGLAARFVSGYLCESGHVRFDAASGATHAWAEIYLPGAGWKGFDPTCGLLAADHHVRVAVARDPRQATPIRGAFLGPAAAFLGLEVTVKARAITAAS